MTYGFKRTGKAVGLSVGIALGLVTALAVMLAGAMLLALLIVSERVGEDAVGWGCMVILPVASALGNLVARGILHEKRLLIAGITTGGFYLLLLALALPFGGLYEGMGTTALLVALGGGIALIPALVESGSGAQRHKNRRIVKLHKK